MKTILLETGTDETRLAVMEDGRLTDFAMERPDHEDNLVNRIYRGTVKNVVPAISSVFVDIGIGRNAFLHMADMYPSDMTAEERRKNPITEGCAVLVQVIKDGTETKGPRVTCRISFPGRYAVLITGTDYIGISRKIRSESRREELRHMGRTFCPAGTGLIVRTAAEKADPGEMEREIGKLADNWDIVRRRYALAKSPSLLYREGDLAVRSIRDYMTDDTDCMLVDDAAVYKRICDIAVSEDKKWQEKVFLYDEPGSMMETMGAEEQIAELFCRQIALPSGGTLVIDYTEALTAVDVNSGSYRGHMSHGNMAYLTNREAAAEIMRQIRLRGIGGIILIDFIDMEKKENQEAILSLLRKEAAKDRVKTVVCGMTSLGLVEMTRKRTVHRLWQNCYDVCPVCGGTGKTLSAASVAIRIRRELKKMRKGNRIRTDLLIQCHPEVAALFREPGKAEELYALTGHQVRWEEGNNPNREVYTILADTDLGMC